MLPQTPLTQTLGIELPIIQAPMAGAVGAKLTLAACEAGALGTLSAAMLTPQQIAEQVAWIRSRTQRPFALNLFVFEPGNASDAQVVQLHRRLASIRAELGIVEPTGPLAAPPDVDAQYQCALQAKPAVLSFTFGIPRREVLDAFRKQGTLLVGTATHLGEAQALEQAGVDAICVQGSEAGGHRGTFIGEATDALLPTRTLVPRVARQVKLPVIAAGGIMDGGAIADVLALGAQAAQLGTAFMGCPEAELHPLHLAALTSPAAEHTRVTRALSGRFARGIVNRLMDALDAHPEDILPYPLQSAAIRDIRAAAHAQGRPELAQLWAGEGARRLRQLPVRELVQAFVDEAGALH